ncbi:elongation factor 1-beta-like [Sycon ciliatum]|uniref:elongation factor 1-beta-like n=1 Tax=Sycon ciliatum TaxID=27933 RepID=UPI0031F71595
MGFGDLSSQQGLQCLNEYLADKSYIDGYVPSQADAAVFKSLTSAPAAELIHALRWYNQINSYETSERTTFPGEARELSSYGPAGASAAAAAAPADEDDDDIDLFGSDEEEDEEAERIKAERLAAYADRKSTKKVVIAKSNIILDVKPWDDETDMNEIERLVRTIEQDGLLWGSSKFVPVGYGIKKLVISCVVEDDKVGIDFLEESITSFEDFVQSVDVAAFNKI